MAAILIKAGGGADNGQAYRIGESKAYAIGRGSGGWVQIVEETVSRTHCIVRFDANKRSYILENVSNTNPTCINGAVISKNTILKDGDLIQIGHVEYEFLMVEPPGCSIQDAIRDTHQSGVPTIPITKSPRIKQ